MTRRWQTEAWKIGIYMGAFTIALALGAIGVVTDPPARAEEPDIIDVDISPGTEEPVNVGCAFGVIAQVKILGVDLYWPAPIPVDASGTKDCNPDNIWLPESTYRWKCYGVEPHEQFYVIFWGKRSKHHGEEPDENWASVSDVDADADSNNNSNEDFRPPEGNASEDEFEYPDSPDVVAGVVIGINDDHDEYLDGGGWNRDLVYHEANPLRIDKDKPREANYSACVSAVKLNVKVNPKRDGKFSFAHIPEFLRVFKFSNDNTKEAIDEDTKFDIAKDENWEKIFYVEAKRRMSRS